MSGNCKPGYWKTMMQHIIAIIPKLNNQHHRKLITILVRKVLKVNATLFPNNRKGRIIFRVIKFAGDKTPSLNRSDTTTHAGNQVIIKKKFAITVIPENKLKIHAISRN